MTLEEFHNVVLPMLITLGPGLHRDPVLMFKIVRIVREALINVCVFKLYIYNSIIFVSNKRYLNTLILIYL